MNTENSVKKNSIITVVFLFLIALISLVVIISEKKIQSNLKEKIEMTFTEEQQEKWNVAEPVKMHTSLSAYSACFRLVGSDLQNGYALITKVQTLYGPFPCVFVYDDFKGVQFIGLVNLEGRIKKFLSASNMHIQYWQNRIPALIATIR